MAQTRDDVYMALDGDDVGRRLEQLICQGNEDDVMTFSADISGLIHECLQHVHRVGGRIVFAAGDSLLCRVPTNAIHSTYAVFRSGDHNVTFSCGVGESMSDAMIALKMAKARGRNELVVWNELQRKTGKP